jgi:predicted ABC-type ATPase
MTDDGISGFITHEPVLLSPQLIQFQPEAIDSYLCARITDFIRLKISFHFETVMSHISRVEFLHLAEQQGYRTYLYFVSTVDPEINIARVQYRVVSQGGHGVRCTRT